MCFLKKGVPDKTKELLSDGVRIADCLKVAREENKCLKKRISNLQIRLIYGCVIMLFQFLVIFYLMFF